jgi:hypothetical protein
MNNCGKHFVKLNAETTKRRIMKIQKHKNWTVQSKGLKITKSPVHMQTMRKICNSKKGFDAALLQLGMSIREEHKQPAE